MNPLAARARAVVRPPDASLPLAPSPLPPRTAWPAVGRCVLATSGMLARRRIWQPTEHIGRTLRFADSTESRPVHAPADMKLHVQPSAPSV